MLLQVGNLDYIEAMNQNDRLLVVHLQRCHKTYIITCEGQNHMELHGQHRGDWNGCQLMCSHLRGHRTHGYEIHGTFLHRQQQSPSDSTWFQCTIPQSVGDIQCNSESGAKMLHYKLQECQKTHFLPEVNTSFHFIVMFEWLCSVDFHLTVGIDKRFFWNN